MIFFPEIDNETDLNHLDRCHQRSSTPYREAGHLSRQPERKGLHTQEE